MPQHNYRPPLGLRNPHIQNIVSSTGPRKWWVRYQTRDLVDQAKPLVLETKDKVRLQGFINQHSKQAKSLIVLFHGWEGSSDSVYVLSAAKRLYQEGHDIFRLNFRDHGNTTHLNREIFNSTRLSDITGAMEALQKQLHYEHYGLAGFSLGGNFTLRTTIAQRDHDYRIDKAMAICPVICPNDTMDALRNGAFFYEQHFVKQWKQSLYDKTRHYPEYTYAEKLKQLKTLDHVNDFFIPGYTPFNDSQSYFDAYHLKGERLTKLPVPTKIITSEDDPIVRHHMLPRTITNSHLSVDITRYGSHCAYLKNYKLQSWADDRLSEWFHIAQQ